MMQNKKKRWALAIFAFVMLCIALWLNPVGRYLIIQGYHQAQVILFRKSIASLVKDPNTSKETLEKLKTVGKIKEFGISLGLKNTKSYNSVFDNGNGPPVWAVSASRKDKLQAVTWQFPIVGTVPYLGFFNKEDAKREFNKLKGRGYDALMRPASAYSTLGILPDPLFTSMLNGGKEYLAETIIHEMTHATIYVKGDTDFNESVATFVGNQGGLDFLKFAYGPKSKEVKNSLDYKHDDEIFSEFMAGVYDELDKYYSSPISPCEKIKGREAIFKKVKERFKKEIKPRLKTSAYDYFEKLKLNNAYILFNRRYHKSVSIFQQLYEAKGSDLKETISFLKTVNGDKDAEKRIKEEIKKKAP